MDSLTEMIKKYWELRQLKKPNFQEAMMWAHTEIAEAYEIKLAQMGGWVRNNPDDHKEVNNKKLQEELGDAIMMLIMAGVAEDGDPISSLKWKMWLKTPGSGLMDPSVEVLMEVKQLLAECRTVGNGNKYPKNALEAENLIIEYLEKTGEIDLT
jgi:hypothetical protein